MSISLAGQFFETLPQDDQSAFDILAALVEAKSPLREAEWLDYKNGRDGKAYEHWSKALSGFGNSGGGIIVWGIQTRTEDKQDVPDSLVLVPNPTELEGQLKTQLSTAVDPPVLGVKTRAIPGNGNGGFVVAYIPESSLKPHQAKAQGVCDKFFIRVSHQHYPSSQALLRQLFYPNSKAIIELNVQLVRGISDEGTAVAITLKNQGAISVEDLFVILRNDGFFRKFECQSGDFVLVDTDIMQTPNFRNLEAQKKLHPGLSSFICRMVVSAAPVYVSLFGTHLEPHMWRILVNASGQVKIDGPFSSKNELETALAIRI